MACQNAFSAQLSEQGFNFFSMLVPDLLHEFELGVWKAIFTHLMRILHVNSYKSDSVQILNDRCMVLITERESLLMMFRYRQVPTFGRGKIRHFNSNAASMKRLAGRDFEDLLQVIQINILGF